MTTDFKNITTLLDFFKSDEICHTWYEQQRWGGSPVCPHCGHDKVYRTTRGFKCANNTCYKKFTVTVGTIFENSKIGLRIWFAAMYLVSTSKNGVSSVQLSEQLGITQKSAWFVLSRIREMLKNNNTAKFTGSVEIDETYVGGKISNKHAKVRRAIKNSTSPLLKTPVVGLLERGGEVRCHVVTNVNRSTVLPIVAQNIAKGGIIYTDSSHMYTPLSSYFVHSVINHEQGEYVRGLCHTNSIEGFWSIMKRGIYGIYHCVSAKHLHRYCDEFSYRYNARTEKSVDRFFGAINKADSARITYKHLIGK